ncbi:hypothetical protein [Cupriavidus nantongensis]|uniref:hypothetical protein n=1 Tax=Cupriavidus nantongensis TaxID=1796606 RepID=UPI00358EC3BF
MTKPHLFVARSAKGTVCGALRLILSAQRRRHIAISLHRPSPDKKLSTIRTGNAGPVQPDQAGPVPHARPEKTPEKQGISGNGALLATSNAPAGRIGEVRARQMGPANHRSLRETP